MFELPGAKRVRREDLYGSGGSNRSESEDEAYNNDLEARLNAQIAKTLGLSQGCTEIHSCTADENSSATISFDGSSAVNQDPVDGTMDGEGGEEGYDFRLFSTAGAASKVVLHDDEVTGEGGLVRPRPDSYYFVTGKSPKQRQQYAYAAVSGEEVVQRSQCRSWGLELPWKVTTINVTRKAKPGEKITGARVGRDPDESTKKRRPGKKRRIALRTMDRKAKKKEEAAAKLQVDKEEQIKEKKKRLNRLKKLRKRAKEKEKKQAGKEDVGDSGEDSNDSEE